MVLFCLILLFVLVYLLALVRVGRDVRAIEALRLRGFVSGGMRSWRYAISQRWAERSQRQRELRQARHEARIAAIQAAGIPGNYAMAGPGGVPVVRLQRTLGDRIRIVGSVLSVLIAAAGLFFTWYIWYYDLAGTMWGHFVDAVIDGIAKRIPGFSS